MLTKIFPFIVWFKDYSPGKFRIDFVAGVTVALVLIPQSMAYAQLAGLPAYFGLYAAFLPPMIASLFGSSRQLATGPVAVVSLMTAASLEPLATAGSDAFVMYAILLALTVGVFQLALGILRLGLIVNFLSHPVVNGFTNAAALIIASSQLSKLFGVYVDGAAHHYETIVRVVEAAMVYIHWPTLLTGLAAIGIMYGLKRLNPRIPSVLIAVIITTLFSWLTGYEHNAKMPLESIRNTRVHETIKVFNQDLKRLEELTTSRSALFSRMDDLKAAHGEGREMLKLEYEIRHVEYEMDEIKEKSHEMRENLRQLKFLSPGIKQDQFVFYLEGEMPPDVPTDGRVWHLKVGNKIIDPRAVLLYGGGDVVGVVPKGVPALTIPEFDFKGFLRLLPFAVIISLLGFMEAIAIAKAMAAKTGQRLDPNQELIGQGLANIIGSFGKSYAVSGSFSRSAVNLQSGAVTGMSSVIASVVVVITLIFFTPLLYHLPQAVLAAVIMMAVIGLLNLSGFIHAWRAQWYDGTISVITFIATLVFAPHLEKGIYIGVALSLSVFLYKVMRPKVASLSRHEDEGLRASDAHGLMRCQYIDLIRFDGPLFFANASFLEDEINTRVLKDKHLKHIIIAANGINDIDASGEETLALIIDRLRSAGYGISFSGINESVMEVFKRTHLLENIGHSNIYPTMEKAITAVHAHAHRDALEEECPLLTVVRRVEEAMKKGEN